MEYINWLLHFHRKLNGKQGGADRLMLLSYHTTLNSGRFHLVRKKYAQVVCRSHAAVSVINAGIPLDDMSMKCRKQLFVIIISWGRGGGGD